MLTAIVAIGSNGVIGKDNQLLWHLPNDLERFKNITSGHTIVMGRKTFLSLKRVLPNREHLVLTRQKDFAINYPDVTFIHSVPELIDLLKTKDDIFVIGGEEIYKSLLSLCTKLYLTIVDCSLKGDAYFPEINTDEWKVVPEETVIYKKDKKHAYSYRFLTFIRK